MEKKKKTGRPNQKNVVIPGKSASLTGREKGFSCLRNQLKQSVLKLTERKFKHVLCA